MRSGRGDLVRPRVDLDPNGVTGTRNPTADDGPVQSTDHERFHPVLEAPDVLDLGHRPDLREALADPGDQQDLAAGRVGGSNRPTCIVGLDGEGDDHAWQHHAGGERQEGQDLGVELSHLSSRFLSRRTDSRRLPVASAVPTERPPCLFQV